MIDLNIIYEVDPKSIQPANYNPRDITDEAYKGLKNSINKFGLIGPLIVNIRTNNLISGHQRLKVAIENEFKSIKVMYIDISQEEEELLNITLNNQKITGYFTEELSNILERIKVNLPEINPIDYNILGLENHIILDNWTSDISKIDKVKEQIEQDKKKIIIDVPSELYDEVMIYIKAKFLETSFEGIHVR